MVYNILKTESTRTDMRDRIVVIDWFGPYSLTEAQQVAHTDFNDGLYMLIGRTKPKEKKRLQYVGLAKKLANRLSKDHHVIKRLRSDLQIWLGEVASPRVSGKKVKVTDSLLDLSEWAHAYFIKLPLNERKKTNPPPRQITVYNRWWKATEDYGTPCSRPKTRWPDIIDFHFIKDDKRRCRTVWFGKKFVEKELK